MKKNLLIGIIILFMVALAGCAKKEIESVDLTVSAAASLTESLKEIKLAFEKQHKGINIHFNIGGSGALKQQILQGAPVDLFLSASEDQFSELIQKDKIEKQSWIRLLGNQLVLITNKENPSEIKNVSDLQPKKVNKVAIGTPDSVPAGKYAKQTLENLGLWEAMESNLIQTKDVSQVLTYVETGNVDAGFVYMTDVNRSDRVKIVEIAGDQVHDPIIYPAGIINRTKNKSEAELFLSYLQSNSAKTIFQKFGFKVLD